MLSEYRYDIVGFSRHVLGIALHPGQERFLTEAIQFDSAGKVKYKFINLTAANRWGKTVCLAVIHLFFAVYKHGLAIEGEDWVKSPYGIINLCPLVDLANVLRDMIEAILEGEAKEQINNPEGRGKCLLGPLFERNDKGGFLVTFGDYKGFRTKVTNVTMEYRTTDDNAKAVQGRRYYLVTMDEVGRQKEFTNLIGAHILPRTLDTGGVVVTGTTPDVDTGTDYEDWWHKGDPDNYFRDPLHYSSRGTIFENPHVTPKQIEELKSGTPEFLLPQVLYGMFVQSSEAFFPKPSIDRAFKAELKPDPERRKGHIYIIGCDLAVVKAGDRSVFAIWDVTKRPCRLIRMVEPHRGTPHPVLIQMMKELLEYYHAEWKEEDGKVIAQSQAILVYDATGLGGKIFKEELANLYPRPRGYDFGGMTSKKFNILSSLRIFLDKDWLEIPGEYMRLKQELKDYKREDAKLATDAVMANALAAYAAERTPPAEEQNQEMVAFY